MAQKRGFQSRFNEEIEQLKSQYETIMYRTDVAKRFQDFPLSQKTLKGLKNAEFIEPTDIQRDSISPALQGKDVLVAAITGSGKTLAFLIPLLERLYLAKWSKSDGIAAIIISPTRELAYQIFETLKKVGKYHDFSAGLIIGGKNLKFERSRMDQCNILICTPGRLLQHMDENPLFNASTMEMLVLDEADRCLDMGFEHTLNAIVENFPPSKQTLLFSATQTCSIKDLARLKLKDPVYIGHQTNVKEIKTPVKVVPDLLQQNYVVVELQDKLTMLWSFVKNHLKQKIIVFLSSCKQVKYVYEIFCKLRPGTSLLALYGTLHQDRRIAIYNDFVKQNNVILFATDIASRGLDFPSVNWVLQLDCPEDVSQYIHRAGRSARNKTRGECLLVLMPSEESGMVDELNRKFLTIQKIQIDPKKLFSPRSKIEAFLAQNYELKASAQRAFVAYIKSVFLMRNKKVFKVHALDFDAFAKSLGLAVTPRLRFLQRYLKTQNIKGEESNEDSKSIDKNQRVVESEKKILLKQFEKKDFLFEDSGSNSNSDVDDDFIKIKRANHEIFDTKQCSHNGNDNDGDLPAFVLKKKEKLFTKVALAKKVLKKKLQMNEKVKFDEAGNEIMDQRKQLRSEMAKKYESEALPSGGIDIEMAKQLLQEEDKFDKQRFRKLVKQGHRAVKDKLKTRDQSKQKVDSHRDYDENDASVDLSWLPDPTKVYNKEINSDVEYQASASFSRPQYDASESTDSDNQDYIQPLTKKAKITSKLNLNDAEVIAKQLLANSM